MLEKLRAAARAQVLQLSDIKEMRPSKSPGIGIKNYPIFCYANVSPIFDICSDVMHINSMHLLPIMEMNTGNKFPSPRGRQQDLTNMSPVQQGEK